MACPSCGAQGDESARFCAQCGARLGAGAAASSEREARKVISALFADIVGSTVLGELLDPEDFTTVVGGAVAIMAGAVSELGGTVSELAGDGLLALFGAPVAHEDDAERAVRVGLRIVERMTGYAEQIRRDWDLDSFAVRVGVETGLAVLAPVGGERSVGYSAMGDSLNTAARLQSEAEPGSVLVGQHTHSSVESIFEWGSPRTLTLKGKAEPVTAYRVIGESQRTAQVRGLRGGDAPLVGRDWELTAAGEAMEALRSGRGGILLVSGEAGIGKSRLLRELRATTDAAGQRPAVRWLDGRCASYGEAVPYLPVRNLLQDWLADDRDATDADERARLRNELARLFGERGSEIQPFLAAVLELELDDGQRARLEALTPEGVQQRTFEAVAELLRRLAQESPLVVALDDMHWADPSSLTLIERLLVLTDSSPLLLVLAARPERDHGIWKLRELISRDFAHRTRDVRLGALDDDADRRLLVALLGVDSLPDDIAQRLLERAEGNPFFLEELVRSLIDAGALVRYGERWRFDPDAPVELPGTVEKVVLAQIDRLTPVCHEVLSAAAVVGRRFELDLLEQVVDGDGVVEDALLELQRLDLVREGAGGPASEYRFRHSLIQEAAYQALLKRRRQELHRRVAAAIEGLSAGREDRVGVLAGHHTAAGDHGPALECHSRAAAAAAGIYAVEEALEHLGAALAAGCELGLSPRDKAIRDLLVQRGDLLYAVGGHQAAATTDLQRAIEGASAAGDAPVHVDALLGMADLMRGSDWPVALSHNQEAVRLGEASGDIALHVRALGRLAIAHVALVQLDSAREAGQLGLELATQAADPETLGLAMDALKLVALQLGDLDSLEQLCDELLETFLVVDASHYLDYALLESSFVPLARCEWEDALARIEEALALARARGHRFALPLFLDPLCWLQRSRGDYSGALVTASEGAEVAAEGGSDEFAAWAAVSVGWVLLELRAPAAAATALERGLDMAERAQATAQIIRCTSLLAWARCLLGDTDAARALADRADELFERVTVPAGGAFLYGAHAYAAVARVWIATGEPERAKALLAPILVAAERVRWYEAIATVSLVTGLSLAARGDSAAAETALAMAVETASEHGLPGVEWEAHAALARLLRSGGREPQAEDHAVVGRAIVERLAAALDDDELRVAFLDATNADLALARP